MNALNDGPGRWARVCRVAWAVLIALCVTLGLVCVLVPKMRAMRRLEVKKAQLLDDKRGVSTQIQSLQEKQHRFKTETDFVVRTAREAGMVGTNEVVFRFSPPASVEPTARRNR